MHPKKRTQIRAGFRHLTPGLALVLSVFAASANAQQNAAASAPAASDEEDNDVVILSAFTVSTERDYGYRAANTISGTRSNTAIKDVPLNIQVFTKDLADDLIITNQVELEAYNASMVNGGADIRSNNPIQQAYNAFLFRGFVQNWGLRDGIREYDPIDAAGLSRVEVVKGPAAALYGLAYPGGVMNNVTKDVDFANDFTSMRFTYENEGGYRAAIDANYSGELSGGKFGVRFNGAHTSTEDSRAHSRGQINYTQLNLNWQPTTATELKFLAENGYREKPNGLGYFTRGAPGSATIPLQIDHPEIPWEWNWADGDNMRSLRTSLYRGTWNQKFSENFQTTAYVQFSRRWQEDGNGWDANGSGGGDSWEAGGGWINAGAANDYIASGYSYRDWTNTMHAYGATGIYKFDAGDMKNTFTFGTNVWSEKFISRSSVQRPDPGESQILIIHPIQAGIDTNKPFGPPADLRPVTDGNGWTHESNSNDYYFVSWQASMLENRLKTNLGINHTNLELLQWANGQDLVPSVTEASENSPMIGAMYDITDEVSFYAVHAKSLFPTTDKNSFGTQMPPVVGSSIEGGFKFALQEGKINGTFSYFRITQTGGSQNQPNIDNLNTQRWDSMTDQQRADAFPGQTRADLFSAGDLVPGAEAQSKGFELDVNYQPTRNLVVAFSFANIDQKVTKATNPSAIGQSSAGAVKTRWSLLSKYTFSDGGLKDVYVGVGLVGTGKALQDYQGGVARYNPSTMGAEMFAGKRFKIGDYSSMIQLNIKNISQVDEFVGWKPNGGALATERYRVNTPITYALTFGIDL